MKLSLIYIKRTFTKNFKETLFLFLIIIFVISLISIVLISVNSQKEASIYYAKNFSGDYHVQADMLREDELQYLLTDNNILNYDDFTYLTLIDTKYMLADMSSNLYNIIQEHIIQGTSPKENEILINIDDKYYFSPDLKIGDEITIGNIPNGNFSKTFKISGFYSMPEYRIKYLKFFIINNIDSQKIIEDENLFYYHKLFLRLKNINTFSFNMNLYKEAFISYNDTYISAHSGNILYPSFMLILFLVIIAGTFIIAISINMSLKKQMTYFNLLKSVGCKLKEFYKITYLQSFILTILSIPFSIGISLSILYIFYKDAPPETFILTVEPSSIIFITLISILMIFTAAYIPVLKIKNNFYVSIKYKFVNITEKLNFKFWYVIKKFFMDTLKNSFIILSNTVCFTVIIVFIYVYISAGTMGTRTFSSLNTDLTIRLDTHISSFNDKTLPNELYETIKNMDDVFDVSKSAMIYDLYFGYDENHSSHNHEESVHKFIMLHLNDNPLFDGIKTYVKLPIMRAELIFNEKRMIEHAIPYIVEGNLDDIFKQNKVLIVDNGWSKNNKSCYHVGDKLIFEKMVYDEINDTYLSTDGKMIELEIGAIIKGIYDNYLKEYTDFPIYINEQTFINLTGQNAITGIKIDCDDENWIQVENNLKSLSFEYPFYIVNHIKSEQSSDNLIIVFLQLLLMLTILIILITSVILYTMNTYNILKRNDEIEIFNNLGIRKNNIYAILISESTLYSLISNVIFLSISNIICFILYKSWHVNPVLYKFEMPVWFMLFIIALCFGINITSSLLTGRKILKEINEVK